ncbi:hypothetical protein [Halomarina oriensis]|uniref:Uncharacterized protein n=1 Tax=Halomarina oriensis TaxID=671145 RepID=A0A6B0GTC5_9EURY|nr:hypothetical protein [Halomarina oriensis]MWG34968.1 hypothetical protein [Halomarina oriensis]
MSTTDALRERFGAAFGASHDAVTTGVVVAFALVLSVFAAWVLADLLPRVLTFVLGVLGFGGVLYGRASRRAVTATGLYALAALVAAIPVVYELVLALSTAAPLVHLLSVTDLLFVGLFWVVALVPAAVGYRVASGPFLPRFRRAVGR